MARILLIEDDSVYLGFMLQRLKIDAPEVVAARRGATAVLAKPFELKQLRSAISLCLGQDRQ